MTPKLNCSAREALWQLFLCGPTWDGNLISKEGNDALCRASLAQRLDGWTYLTGEGVRHSLAMGYGGEKEKEPRHVLTDC